jgi:hypothetical protein
MTLRTLCEGVYRFLLLVAGAAAVTVSLSLGVGALLGASVSRSASLGLYLIGSFILISGFFSGNRGPLRAVDERGYASFWTGRTIRRATEEERRELLGASVLYMTMGAVLIALGVVADSRVGLV